MVRVYQRLSRYLKNRQVKKYYTSLQMNQKRKENDPFVHSLWAHAQPKFADLILKGIPNNFLQNNEVRKMFYRAGFDKAQEHELNYLQKSSMWELVKTYQESPIGQPTIDCEELNISVNSLGMLYYFVRITEHIDMRSLNTIVEFGGGFGSLCRVFLELLPQPTTYIIFDLPEMLALQYAYLSESAQQEVVAPLTQPIEIKQGCINLVPSEWATDLNIKSDLFVSTFALSESPASAQNMVVEKKFFDALSIYLVGQHVNSELWQDLEFVPMNAVQNFIEDSYSNVAIQPFHFADAWEILGQSRKLL